MPESTPMPETTPIGLYVGLFGLASGPIGIRGAT
jgi:hypothetical protein